MHSIKIFKRFFANIKRYIETSKNYRDGEIMIIGVSFFDAYIIKRQKEKLYSNSIFIRIKAMQKQGISPSRAKRYVNACSDIDKQNVVHDAFYVFR